MKVSCEIVIVAIQKIRNIGGSLNSLGFLGTRDLVRDAAVRRDCFISACGKSACHISLGLK